MALDAMLLKTEEQSIPKRCVGLRQIFSPS